MARSARAEKKEIYGVFDGCGLIEIGSWDLVEGALPYAGEEAEIISLARMSPSILKIRKAEIKIRQGNMKMPWRKWRRFVSPRDWALYLSSRDEYKPDLAA